jgi:hypothetical protein
MDLVIIINMSVIIHHLSHFTQKKIVTTSVEIFIVLRHIFGIVLRRLLLVHGVEIEVGVIVLDWLEVHAQGLLDTW